MPGMQNNRFWVMFPTRRASPRQMSTSWLRPLPSVFAVGCAAWRPSVRQVFLNRRADGEELHGAGLEGTRRPGERLLDARGVLALRGGHPRVLVGHGLAEVGE